jgi:DNA processing protein
MKEPIVYKIALSLVPGIGGVLARNLVAYLGSPEAIFTEKPKILAKVPGIGEINIKRISDPENIARAEKELKFLAKYNIDVRFYTDPGFPRRLLSCPDAPVLIFSKGNFNPDEEKIISIVGTRNATEYGKEICETLVGELAERNHRVLIVSGLAYGIDIYAHKAAIKHNLPTVGILGHGLDTLYPGMHKDTASRMLENGGLATDFASQTKIDPSNFIRRNRIIAGMADATIVVESGEKGGALVTARIAGSYNRDVFAFPGRVGDVYSVGCNNLIKTNGAALITSVADLEYIMGWDTPDKKPATIQKELFTEFSDEERLIIELLKKVSPLFIDQVCSETGLPMSKVSGHLLNLEFKGVVAALPGKMYKLK